MTQDISGRDPSSRVLGEAAALRREIADLRRTVAALRRSVAVLRDAARCDPLTGLANRAYLDERLRQALSRARRQRTPVGLLMIDLNDFKSVNDTFGHTAGDGVLREVALRLRACTRPEDTIARFGGDEFVVLFEDVAATTAGGLEASAAAVARRVAEAIRVRVERAVVTASVGYAVGGGDADPAGLVAAADASMYQQKRDRRRGRGKRDTARPELDAAASSMWAANRRRGAAPSPSRRHPAASGVGR